ncbi:MAG: hypothetical protein ACRD1T_15930, partial [Acidimicrobiia bacterium]
MGAHLCVAIRLGIVRGMVTAWLTIAASPAQGQVIDFIRQFGTSSTDMAHSVAIDATGIYVVGLTFGTLPGQLNNGGGDAYVRKYDKCGNVLWTRQFGTDGFDEALDVAVHAFLDQVAVVGRTTRTLGFFPPNPEPGTFDGFLRTYNSSGGLAITCQLAHPGESQVHAVANSFGPHFIVAHQGMFGVVSSGTDVELKRVELGFPCELNFHGEPHGIGT